MTGVVVAVVVVVVVVPTIRALREPTTSSTRALTQASPSSSAYPQVCAYGHDTDG
ncbi:hypothetical protein [Streptomyces sp. NPDC020817]|uniref:hypothetical protein n=1 Tax=Streptomyces sp. NPDC020817 TaxID=3365095 RepID=UPI0037BC37A8